MKCMEEIKSEVNILLARARNENIKRKGFC